MKIKVATIVEQDYRQVCTHFDRKLFERLNPPFPSVKVQRFDGMAAGDEVHLELNFLFRREKWISRITDFSDTDDEIYFIDEGIQLPFIFKSWWHKHHMIRRGEQTEIIDEVDFQCHWPALNYLMLPVLYLQFLYRKPIYRAYFKNGHQKKIKRFSE